MVFGGSCDMPELNNTETFVCFLHCLESGLELRSVMRNPNWEAVRGCGLNSSGRMQNATATPGPTNLFDFVR